MITKAKILIVDDDTHMCSGLQLLLDDQGYATQSAFSGEQAKQMLTRETFDIVLLDLMMPDIDGYELLNDCGPCNNDTMYIVITGYASIDSAVQALRKGAYDYIRKPFEPDELITTVKNALNQKNLRAAKKRAEDSLKTSERRYRSFIENFRGIAYQGNLLAVPEFFYGAVEPLTGYAANAFISGQISWQQLIHPDDASAFAQHWQKIDPSPANDSFEQEYRIIRRDGQIRWVHEIRQTVLNDFKQSVLIQGILDDITVRKRLEDHYRNAQKMEAVSTLAGGIAHQFNNALIGITGNIELLTLCCHDNQALQKYVAPMLNAAKRMSRLTKQLLAYAQSGKYNPRIVSLNELIADTVDVIRHSIDDSIRIQTDLTPDIALVRIDITQIQMVLSALISNAAEAIEAGGCIRIHTETRKIDQAHGAFRPNFDPGPYAYLTVTDDGKGMAEDIKAKIFDPFYTTKFQGRGLGMAASYGIIKNHGGWITIDSAPGRGTTMGIYLPGVATRAKISAQLAPASTEGTETILIVDDEAAVVDVYCEMLEHLGYRILVARSGQEAIDLVKRQPDLFDLTILDIGLPDLRGDKVYHRIREIRPDLKIIVSTGYAVEQVAQEMNLEANDFIQKPYDILTLSSRIQKVLKGA